MAGRGAAASGVHRDQLAVVGSQRLVGHDEIDLDADLGCLHLTGDALDQRVGLDLAPGAAVTGADEGVGVPGQCRLARDALGHRQQRTEAGHDVGGWAHADPSLALGLAQPLDVALWIKSVGDRLGRGLHPAVAELRQLRGEFRIDCAAVFAGQPGRLAKVRGSSVIRMRDRPR